MSSYMTNYELWGAMVLSILCFTGLWGTTKQIGIILRSGEKTKNPQALAKLFFWAWGY